MKHTLTTTALLLSATVLFASACEQADMTTAQEQVESGDALTTPLGFTTCNNVFDMIEDNSNHQQFTVIRFAYADAFRSVAGEGSVGMNSARTTLTESSADAEVFGEGYNGNEIYFRLRKTSQTLGTQQLATTARITFVVSVHSTAAEVVSFEAGAVECTVSGNTATITTIGPNDGRLTMKLAGQYIGG